MPRTQCRFKEAGPAAYGEEDGFAEQAASTVARVFELMLAGCVTADAADGGGPDELPANMPRGVRRVALPEVADEGGAGVVPGAQ